MTRFELALLGGIILAAGVAGYGIAAIVLP